MPNKCNVCGGSELSRFGVLPKITTGKSFAASGFKTNGEELVKCDDCGLVFIHNPIIYPDAIIAEYAKAVDTDYVSQMGSRIKTFRDSIIKVEDITRLKYNRHRRILDIGAAAGAFVKAAADRSWSAYGVEPCKYLVKWGKENLGLGTHLKEGTIEDVDLGEFDVITFWDVLEHTSDPNSTIKTAVGSLKAGGYIVVNIPDISTIIPRVMGMRWPFYESAHLYYFTGETLDKLMRNHGLERIYGGMYFQELTLGYLAYRFEQFSPGISKILKSVVYGLGLDGVPIKYWIGQSLFVYKNIGRG